MTERNPFIIPSEKPGPKRGCRKCGGENYGGRMVFGYAEFKCRDCGFEWMGGVGQVAQDPTVPAPPRDPKSLPNVDFIKTKQHGDQPVPVTVKRPDLTPDFRKGAPIPPPGEENDV